MPSSSDISSHSDSSSKKIWFECLVRHASVNEVAVLRAHMDKADDESICRRRPRLCENMRSGPGRLLAFYIERGRGMASNWHRRSLATDISLIKQAIASRMAAVTIERAEKAKAVREEHESFGPNPGEVSTHVAYSDLQASLMKLARDHKTGS